MIATIAAALAAFLAAGAAAAAPDRIRYLHDWAWEAPGAPILMAAALGWYADAGLDVEIAPGAGSIRTVARVASGHWDVGSADLNQLARFRDLNPDLDVRAVLVLHNAPPFAVLGRRSLGVDGPRSLEGRTLGAPPPDGAWALWPAFTRAAGIDPERVTVEPVTFATRERSLAAGGVAAITGYSYSLVPKALALGVEEADLSLMLMSDHGLALYGNALVASPRARTERRDALRRFVEVTVRAHLAVIRYPEAGLRHLFRAVPDADETAERRRLSMLIEHHLVTPEVRANGFGGLDPARLRRALDQLGETWTWIARPTVEDLFDPGLLPPAAMRAITP